jgi:hypothetical protein
VNGCRDPELLPPHSLIGDLTKLTHSRGRPTLPQIQDFQVASEIPIFQSQGDLQSHVASTPLLSRALAPSACSCQLLAEVGGGLNARALHFVSFLSAAALAAHLSLV